MDEFPAELRSPPRLLAALVGAAPLHARLEEALHESSVSSCGQQRVKYLSCSYDIRIPPCKRGHKDAEDYRVSGILKQRWLEKMCNSVPGVLVVCFDWSANMEVPESDISQAVNHLQHARRQAEERRIRILLFLVMHATAADPETQCAALRAQPEGDSLILACGVDDVAAKAAELELLIYQLADSYYADEEQRQRKVWAVKPPTQPLWALQAMQVRVSFKVGFLSELRRDSHGALRSYIEAYEQLVRHTEIASEVERMGLCNCIAIRMYQLYLQSHDFNAAVHHCRVHESTLRACSLKEEVAWRQWHWLAINRQSFAEILESFAQQFPRLIDQADAWHFPGFHYQAAAGHARQLRQWAARIASGGALPAAANAGGDLLPAEFVGQLKVLERPEECGDPVREVNLRQAQEQLQEVRYSDHCLHLQAKAQAACKEREHTLGQTVSSDRITEESMSDGAASPTTDEPLLGVGSGGQADRHSSPQPPWVSWPGLQRLTLENSIFCSCKDLGLQEPSICASLPGAAPGRAAASADHLAAARRALLWDAFEYLGLPPESGPSASKETEIRQAELLQTVRAALGSEWAEDIEVPLDAAHGEVAFATSAAGPGGHSTMSVQLLWASLAAVLEVTDFLALTSRGNIKLHHTSPQELGGSAASWQCERPVTLQGSWPPAGVAGASAPVGGVDQVDGVRAIAMSWGAHPQVRLLVSNLQGKQSPAPAAQATLLPPRGRLAVPRWHGQGRHLISLLGASAAPARPAEGQPGPGVAEAQVPHLRANVMLPVDPSTALTGEPFLFHVALLCARQTSDGPRPPPGRLVLSCNVTIREEPQGEQDAVEEFSEPQVCLLRRGGEGGNGEEATAPASWEFLPLGAESDTSRVVAEIAEGGTLGRSGPAVAFAEEQLVGAPLQLQEGETSLAVPVVVRCGRVCRLSVALSLHFQGGSGGDGTASAAMRIRVPSVSVSFRPALLPGFDALLAAGHRAHALRRFSLKSLAPVALELRSVCLVAGTKESCSAELPVPALGPLGRIGPGASHTFALPRTGPPLDAEGAATLLVSFARSDVAAAFCPWPAGAGVLPAGPAPAARSSWPPPRELLRSTAHQVALRIELEHASEGAVAEPLLVKVWARTLSSPPPFEVKVVVLHGEGSDKFFINGMRSSQALFLSSCSGDASQSEAGSCFTLVPLKPGWLAVPRVQVSAGGAEVTSTPSSIFVFPSKQPILWRNSS